MLDLAKLTRADVIVFPTITQYSPYPRPRLGLILQAVSPLDGKVIASVDGLWDTTDAAIAEQVRTFYRQRPKPLPPRVRNHEIATDDSFAGELALDSPALFQRYVCHLGSRVLIGLPETGGVPMQTDRPISLPRWRAGGLLPAKGTAPRDGCEPSTVPAVPGIVGTMPPSGTTPPTPTPAVPMPALPPVMLPPPRKDISDPLPPVGPGG